MGKKQYPDDLAMDYRIKSYVESGWAKARHDQIQALVSQGTNQSLAEALRLLDCFGVFVGIASSLELVKTDPKAFDVLAGQARQSNHHWGRFYVRLAKKGHMPTGLRCMTKAFYHSARCMLLMARAQYSYLHYGSRWPKSDTLAKTRPFYPEMLVRHKDRRERICAIAQDHVGHGPDSTKQTLLFSLGGWYDWRTARNGTNLQPGATTCYLVARSVLHAAGCNVISDRTSRQYCTTQGFSELPSGIAVQSPTLPSEPPRPGDIFLIRGDSYDRTNPTTGKKESVDSSHVGVIVKVNSPTNWDTVEGGASDHVTVKKVGRNLSRRNGHWSFDDDTQAKVQHRPLRGWINIDRTTGQWMRGA